jgi:hypothetical protein
MPAEAEEDRKGEEKRNGIIIVVCCFKRWEQT